MNDRNDRGDRFLESCGATGPLCLEWDEPTTGEPVRREFRRPAVLIGRHPRCDIVLGHQEVGLRHAYLQLIEGRLFALHMEGRDGLSWGGVPRPAGWVERGRPVRIGRTTVRVIGGDVAADWSGPTPVPTSSRFVARRRMPEVCLDLRGPAVKTRRCLMDRVFVLIGNSERCQVRLNDPAAPAFACALIGTPGGVWAVDLLSSQGVTVNGAACRHARLEDGDRVGIGGQTVRVFYAGLTAGRGRAARGGVPLAAPESSPPVPAALPGPVPVAPYRATAMAPAPVAAPAPEADDDSPETILRPLLEMAQQGGTGGAPSPFGEALVTMVRLLGEVHRDHLNFVREELAQIRHLSEEVAALRAQMDGRPHGPAPGPALPFNGHARVPGYPDGFDPLGGFVEPTLPRPDPATAQALVGERLAAWEREQKGRWRKVLEMLVKH